MSAFDDIVDVFDVTNVADITVTAVVNVVSTKSDGRLHFVALQQQICPASPYKP
jgi:hypothetical protein